MAVAMSRTYKCNPYDLAPVFRTESGTWLQTNGELQTSNYIEKRQVFLRSYQFSRKQSLGEKIKRSLVRLKRALWFRIRTARKLRKVVWFGLRNALNNKRRRLSRIMNNYCYYNGKKSKYEYFYSSSSPFGCFC